MYILFVYRSTGIIQICNACNYTWRIARLTTSQIVDILLAILLPWPRDASCRRVRDVIGLPVLQWSYYLCISAVIFLGEVFPSYCIVKFLSCIPLHLSVRRHFRMPTCVVARRDCATALRLRKNNWDCRVKREGKGKYRGFEQLQPANIARYIGTPKIRQSGVYMLHMHTCKPYHK